MPRPLAVRLLGLFFVICPILASNLVLDHYQPLKVGSFLILLPIAALLFFRAQSPSSFAFNHFDIFLGFFILWFGASLGWSLNRVSALETFVLWLTGFFLYFSLRAYRPPMQAVRFWGLCLLISLFLNVLYGLLQVADWEPFNIYYFKWIDELPVAFLGHANYAAEYTLVGLAVLTGMFLHSSSKLKWGCAVALLPCLVFFYFLRNRASWLGYFAVLFFYLLYGIQPWLQKMTVRQRGLSMVGIGVVMLGVAVTVIQLHPKLGSPESVRFNRYLNLLVMVKDHPLLGVGMGNFVEYYPLYYQAAARDPEMHPAMIVDDPHSDYLRFFAEGGLVGGFLFLALVGSVLWHRPQEVEGAIAKFTLIGIFVNCLFAFPLRHPQILMVFFTALALLANEQQQALWQWQFPTKRRWWKVAFYAAVSLLILMGLKHIAARHFARESAGLMALGKEEVAEKAYRITILLSPSYEKPHYELVTYYMQHARYEEALQYVEHALKYHPYHWPFLYTKADLLRVLGRGELAQPVLEEAQRIMPR